MLYVFPDAVLETSGERFSNNGNTILTGCHLHFAGQKFRLTYSEQNIGRDRRKRVERITRIAANAALKVEAAIALVGEKIAFAAFAKHGICDCEGCNTQEKLRELAAGA